MPEKKWFRGRPIRRTKANAGFVKVIFDDGPSGIPGDTIYVNEVEYVEGVKKQFVKNDEKTHPNRVRVDV